MKKMNMHKRETLGQRLQAEKPQSHASAIRAAILAERKGQKMVQRTLESIGMR